MKGEALLNKYMDDFTAMLYEHVQDTHLCVEILLPVFQKLIKSSKRWKDEYHFYYATQANIFAELAKHLRHNTVLRQRLQVYVKAQHFNLGAICQEMEQSPFPRSKIAELYLIQEKGPSEIAALLGLKLNTVKYHCKTLCRKLGIRQKPSFKIRGE